MLQNPFPRGEGGPPERKRGKSGSEEECGQKSEIFGDLSDLMRGMDYGEKPKVKSQFQSTSQEYDEGRGTPLVSVFMPLFATIPKTIRHRKLHRRFLLPSD
jgi:hypothetical protein